MRARSGEGVVAVTIALVLFGGVALDTWGPKVSGVSVRTVRGPEFSARAVFCPPSLGNSIKARGSAQTGGQKAAPASQVSLTAAARGDEAVSIGIEPGSEGRAEIAPGQILQHKPPTAGASDVVGYGGPIDATAVTSVDEPVAGVGAGACSRRASTRWYFPEGNSTITHDERLLIYNPFPDEAVVGVTLLTPAGERTKAGLSDIAVPSEDYITVAMNDWVREQKVLGAIVSAVRGRLVVWRLSLAKPDEKPSGIQFTLGSTVTAEVWHFPDGAIGEGFDERLSIMNPGPRDALVDVSLVTPQRTEQVAALTQLPVPGRSTIVVTVDASMIPDGGGGTGAIVRSVNGERVVVERTVFYAAEDYDGTASEIGAPFPAERWLLGPATSRPEADSAVLMNPGTTDVEVTLELLRAGGRTLRPRTLRDLPIATGARLRVPLSKLTRGETVAVLVTATGPVVAERFSYSPGAGDVASVMGIPLDE